MKNNPHIPNHPIELSSLLWFFSFWGRNLRYFFTSTMQKTVFPKYYYDEICNFGSYSYSSTTSYTVTPTPMKTRPASLPNTAYSTDCSGEGLLGYAFGLGWDDVGCMTGGYCFGFNNQEKDDEIYGLGNSYTAEFWQYDARLGRRWNVDPQFKKYPDQSPYACFFNNPVLYSDINGDEPQSDNDDRPKRKDRRSENRIERVKNKLEEKLKRQVTPVEIDNVLSGKRWYEKYKSSTSRSTGWDRVIETPDAEQHPINNEFNKTGYDFNPPNSQPLDPNWKGSQVFIQDLGLLGNRSGTISISANAYSEADRIQIFAVDKNGNVSRNSLWENATTPVADGVDPSGNFIPFTGTINISTLPKNSNCVIVVVNSQDSQRSNWNITLVINSQAGAGGSQKRIKITDYQYKRK